MKKCLTMDQAFAEANRCLLCHDAPCSKGCPASTQPDSFIRKLRFMNLKGAIAVIKNRNVFGGVCAAVCPTCKLCEQGCVASGIGEPIDIAGIQRFLVEYGWHIGFRSITPAPLNGRKVAVIGAGPSGLTCASEVRKHGYAATVFEQRAKAGGMLQYAIPEHRLSREFVDRELAEILELGIDLRCNSPIASQAELNQLLASGFDAVYLSPGTWKTTSLNNPRPKASNIFDALSFLALAKENPSQFAAAVAHKSVAVLGGGDTATDAATTALQHGAADSYLIYRRSYLQMPGSAKEKQSALEEGVHFIFFAQPVDFVVEDDRVKGVKLVRTKLGEPDASLRRTPLPVAGSEHVLEAEIIVEAMGLTPEDSLRQLTDLSFDRHNHIIVRNDDGETSMARVFAGGDAVRGAAIVAHAVADGKRAATAIMRMLGITVDQTRQA